MPRRSHSTIAKLPPTGGEPDASHGQHTEVLDVGKALELVRRGGRSKRQREDDKPVERRLSLRLPEETVDRVRTAAQARPVKTPSHSWIVEAILEKLKKESF